MTSMCVCVCKYIYQSIYLSIYIYIYICARARTHTHTHTHTHVDLFICEPDARGATEEEDALLSSDTTDVTCSRFVGP